MLKTFLRRGSVSFRAMSVLLTAVFLASILLSDFASLSYAQGAAEPLPGLPVVSAAASSLNLPSPDKLIELSPSYQPVSLRGLRFYPEDPLRFDFLVDKPAGDGGQPNSRSHRPSHKPSDDELKSESSQLIKYFLASLTIPEEDLWVNLSPYESERVVPEELGLTDMGKDLLAQDYLLKQLIASLTYPETPVGQEFWDKAYKQAYQLFGTSKIPINTFNKVWIVPDKAVVYEDKDRVILGESKLKVMLEEDYLAFKNRQRTEHRAQRTENRKLTEKDEQNINSFSSSIMKEVILPQIEKEVNEGKNFAQLRQIYASLILAVWFKQKLKTRINADIEKTQINADENQTTEEPILSRLYIDKKKIKGVDSADPKVKEKVYSLYLEAYKNGLYNYIKKDFDPYEKKQIKRRYYSGGLDMINIVQFISASPLNQAPSLVSSSLENIEIKLQPQFPNDNMSSLLETATTSSSAAKKQGQPLCLTPDSLITLADSSQKPLIELSATKSGGSAFGGKPFPNPRGSEGGAQGDMVLSLNEQTKKLEPHRVLALLDMGVKPVYRIATASGKTLKTTLTHPYRTPDGWKKLKDIKVGDEITVMQGQVVVEAATKEGLFLKESEKDSAQYADYRGKLTNPENKHPLNYIGSQPADFFGKSSFKSFFCQRDNVFLGSFFSFIDNFNQGISAFISKFISQDLRYGNYRHNLSFIHLKRTYHMFAALSRVFSPLAYAESYKSEVSWDKIISIEPLGSLPVYDIEVEATHNFIAQGIVAHNTYSQQRTEKQGAEYPSAEAEGTASSGLGGGKKREIISRIEKLIADIQKTKYVLTRYHLAEDLGQALLDNPEIKLTAEQANVWIKAIQETKGDAWAGNVLPKALVQALANNPSLKLTEELFNSIFNLITRAPIDNIGIAFINIINQFIQQLAVEIPEVFWRRLAQIKDKDSKCEIFNRIIEPLFFKRPDLFTDNRLKTIGSVYAKDVPEFKYLLFYASLRETGPPAYDPALFPHQVTFRQLMSTGRKRALVMHNIRDGQGDELIRTSTLIHALLDLNPELEMVIYTDRGYLYGRGKDGQGTIIPSHPRVEVRDIHSYDLKDEEQFDMIIHYYNYSDQVENSFREYLNRKNYKDNPASIYVKTNKAGDKFIYEEIALAGKSLSFTSYGGQCLCSCLSPISRIRPSF